MKRILGLAILIAFSFAPLVLAQNSGSGCGLGKKLFEGQRGLIPNVLAVTTNGTSSNDYFGMTSGTSGCDADTVILNEKEQEVFVAANLDNLSEDIANGDGPYLHSMATLMGCGVGAYADFAALTQSKYESLLPDADTAPAIFLTGLKRELVANPTLASSCMRVS